MTLIVDAWMQHPTARFSHHEMFAAIRRWTGQPAPEGDVSLAETIAAMDAASIDVGVLAAWHGPEGAIISNDEVAAAIALHPDRLVGLAAVDLRYPMDAVRELRRMVRGHGFRGLRILPWLWGLPPNDRRYYPLYAECVELGVPVCTQVGHTGPLRTSETGRPIPYLDDVALEFPELVIVAGHIGYPWQNEMIALARKYVGVHIDTSAYMIRRYPAELVSYLKTGGRKKVLFGSNYPMLTPRDAMTDLGSLELDEEARALFLGKNAARVFALRT